MYGRPLVPPSRDEDRKKYRLRGTIVGHSEKVTGWWIFKERMPTVQVRFQEDDWALFNKTVQEEMSDADGNRLQGVASTTTFGMTKEEIKRFPVGIEVAVTFGYAGAVDQYFRDAKPLKLLLVEVYGSP